MNSNILLFSINVTPLFQTAVADASPFDPSLNFYPFYCSRSYQRSPIPPIGSSVLIIFLVGDGCHRVSFSHSCILKGLSVQHPLKSLEHLTIKDDIIKVNVSFNCIYTCLYFDLILLRFTWNLTIGWRQLTGQCLDHFHLFASMCSAHFTPLWVPTLEMLICQPKCYEL